MKRIWKYAPGFLLLVALAQVAMSQQTAGSLQGVVVRDATGGPLSKAVVEVRGGQLQQTTTTESDGRFFFRNLPFGAYEITVRRDGFAPAEYGQKWPGGPGIALQLRPGQPAPDLNVRMVAAASISGRITDSNGQPMANAQVQALKSSFQGERRILVPVQQVRTSVTGDFRLYWLPAGRYFVNVIVPGYSGNSQLLVNSGGRTEPGAFYQTNSQPRSILAESGGCWADLFPINAQHPECLADRSSSGWGVQGTRYSNDPGAQVYRLRHGSRNSAAPIESQQ
jgi:hypothetical protein